jgi:protein SCO1/2
VFAVSSAAKRGLVIFLAGLAVLLAALGVEYWRLSQPEFSVETAAAPGSVPIGGDFTLVDQNGVTRHAADFEGKLLLVYFGYTYCPDVCPTELQRIVTAMDDLGDKAAGVTPIFITVDPARDTPQQLKSYAAAFSPRLVALTGSEQQVAAAARAYKVYYRKAEEGDGTYLMDHSSFVYLMGRDGKYLAHFSPQTTPDQMAAVMSKYL